jgi:putative Ig domain-containing protein
MKSIGVARHAALTVLCALALQACGGGGGASTSTAGSPPPSGDSGSAPGNAAPSITGTPATQVQAGQPYTFTAQATDPNQDKLTFSISNKPSWAQFNATTGTLSGAPSSAGTFANVTISVSDGTSSVSLAPFSILVTAAPTGGTTSVTLSWMPPTERTDGSPLVTLAGYKIHYGQSSGDYPSVVTVDNAGLSSYVIDALSSGTYYFMVTAYDTTGYESAPSAEVSKKIG